MVEFRKKSNNHVKFPSKRKTVNAIEAVSGKTPCHTLPLPACTDVVVHLPNTIILIAPASAEVGLIVASSSLRPPNSSEGILASRPIEVPLLRNLVRTNVQYNSKMTNFGSRRVIPSPASP
ncbi:hypothetical protein NC653_007155 [Populus alba x Populus x berolinensis]|uniref:Uncharacterized protein n=1 Tax=Populus alba x Populus x berolinensis TaxID=444605 RepID=A0AAD6WDJ3_9ROSI|nr:hypothetical protein NC653_007155 [Populus alba x Populus x berolinensis]